jgi:transposase
LFGSTCTALRTGVLPEPTRPPELRDLLRHRVALTRMRAALKNCAGAILAKYNVRRPFADVFGPGGLRFLETLVLPESARRRLDSTLVLIADFTRKIERTTREIDTCASDDPHFEVLCQIRGVDRYIAMLVIADVGDVSRLRARAISAPGPG